jgi:hypothetical protein
VSQISVILSLTIFNMVMAGLCFLTLERMLLTSSFVKLQCDLDNWHDNYETGDCVLCDGCCDSNIGSNTIPLLLKALLGSTNLDKISNQLIYSMSVKNHTVPLSALIIISTCFVNCTWGIDSCNSWRNSGTSPWVMEIEKRLLELQQVVLERLHLWCLCCQSW